MFRISLLLVVSFSVCVTAVLQTIECKGSAACEHAMRLYAESQAKLAESQAESQAKLAELQAKLTNAQRERDALQIKHDALRIKMLGDEKTRAGLVPSQPPPPNRLGEVESAVSKFDSANVGTNYAFDWGNHSAADKQYWTQCRSEGGNVSCAKCTGSGGGLVCDAVPSRTSSGNDPADCPDSLGKIKYFLVSGVTGKGMCFKYKDNTVLQASADYVLTYTGSKDGIVDGSVTLYNNATDILPGADGTFLGPHILSKGTTAHPHKAGLNIGAILFKRVVMHPHTTRTTTNEDGDERPVMVGDVFKQGYCIKCPTDVFSSIWSHQNDKSDHENFYNNCLVDAFDANDNLKSDYKCDVGSRDYRLFLSTLSAG